MRRRILLSILVALWPAAALACKCADSTPSDLRATFERIALVEVIELGPEFDGPSPIANMAGRNRYVRVRVIESLAGDWGPEETVAETLRIGGGEFDCPLYTRPGEKLILFLIAKQTLVDWCNTRGPDPTLLEALRRERKGA